MLMSKTKTKGFTLVELLTVISIITLIIGLLVPAMNKVNIIAKDMKQKAQFHAIVTGLEMFKTENEEYPGSSRSMQAGNTEIVTGAHKLAEALVGRDMQGYDPVSNIDNPEDYSGNPYGLTNLQTVNENALSISLERRQGPYLSIDNLGAFDISQVYDNKGDLYPGRYDDTGASVGGNSAPVLVDVYKAKKIQLPNSNKTVNVGTPILYYKANPAENFNDTTAPASSVYNIEDNDDLVVLGTVKDQTKLHKIEDNNSYDHDGNASTTAVNGLVTFYDMIKNNSASANLTGTRNRPYKADSFIIISAGYDGVFGTDDDITNYQE